MALHAAGKIAPLVSEVLPMSDAGEGTQRLADRGTIGKLVVATRASRLAARDGAGEEAG